jgi:hypothetical protein
VEIKNLVLAFEVTPKLFTPCLGVLHENWGTWYMFNPLMIHDGFAHCRWITQWLLDLDRLLGALENLHSLGEVLHDGRMEMVSYLENTLLRRRSILHLGGGY